MKAFEITFSLRDWREGRDLLIQLGFVKENTLCTEQWDVVCEDEDKEDELRTELADSGLEFEIVHLKGYDFGIYTGY